MILSTTEKTISIIVGVVGLVFMIGGAYLGSKAGQDKRFDNIEDKILMIEATYPDKGAMVDVIKESIDHHTAVPHPASAPKRMLMDTKDDIVELKRDIEKSSDRQEQIRDEQVEQGKDLVEIKSSLKILVDKKDP